MLTLLSSAYIFSGLRNLLYLIYLEILLIKLRVIKI